MRASALLITLTLSLTVTALPTANSPSELSPRQDIDFALADELPDPNVTATASYNEASALSAVIANINASPLPQKRRKIKRGVTGYSDSVVLGNLAINAPLNCIGSDTFMGAKLWNDNFFDETRCAVACTAQSVYNLKHPPSSGQPKTCQFYNTYVLLKNSVPQGQYCSLYTQAWDVSRATNNGQWRGKDHYTIFNSTMAYNATNSGDVRCPSDVSYLSASGQAFCTAYLTYVAPTSTVTVVTSPATSIFSSTFTSLVTSTVFDTELSTQSLVTTTTVVTGQQKRDIQTPASVSTWAPSRISAACSSVVSGVITTSTTATVAIPISTQLATTVQTVLATSTTTTVVSVISTSTTITTEAYSPTATINVNGGFETEYGRDIPGWTGSGHSYPIYNGVEIHSGGCSVEFWPDSSVPAGTSITVGQTLSGLNTASNFYGLTFWYDAEIFSSTCTLSVDLGTTNLYSKILSVGTPASYNGTNVFTPVTVDFITPPSSTADLVVGFRCIDQAASNRLHLDDIYFTSGIAVPIVPKPVYTPVHTLITDGGFEGSDNAWVYTEGVYTVDWRTWVPEGKRVLLINNGQNAGASQTITGLDPTSNLYGLTLLYAFYARGDTVCTFNVDLGDTNLFTQTTFQNLPAVDAGQYNIFTPLKIDFITPPSTTAGLKFRFSCDRSDNSPVVFIDKIAFTSGTSS